jgi:hypothetical protein
MVVVLVSVAFFVAVSASYLIGMLVGAQSVEIADTGDIQS